MFTPEFKNRTRSYQFKEWQAAKRADGIETGFFIELFEKWEHGEMDKKKMVKYAGALFSLQAFNRFSLFLREWRQFKIDWKKPT
jgi:hypothetical protein